MLVHLPFVVVPNTFFEMKRLPVDRLAFSLRQADQARFQGTATGTGVIERKSAEKAVTFAQRNPKPPIVLGQHVGMNSQ